MNLNHLNQPVVYILGAGLAGCECALTLADKHPVVLIEQKPEARAEAYASPYFAELVCSNSFKSKELKNATGLLKHELFQRHSPLMQHIREHRVPAHKALAVDRDRFSSSVTQAIRAHPNIRLLQGTVTAFTMHAALPSQEGFLWEHGVLTVRSIDRIVVATGPLTSAALVEHLKELIPEPYLYFYDAIAPILDASTIHMERCFWGSRYTEENQDYLNCPMNRDEYQRFYQALLSAEKVPLHSFESVPLFQDCQPIEDIASHGERSLVFGPLKPVGMVNPKDPTQRYYAVVQLRKENHLASAVNMVGFQTKLTYPEQKRVFRLIPGLEDVEFLRYGSIHKNTFIHSPRLLSADLSLKNHPHIHFAGQITGSEGYTEAIATGHYVAHCLLGHLGATDSNPYPNISPTRALTQYLTQSDPSERFQPMHIHWGVMMHTYPHEKRERNAFIQQYLNQFPDPILLEEFVREEETAS